MKNNIKVLFTLTVLIHSSCNGSTSYINSFESFVDKVEAKCDTYSSEDWERSDIEFEKYTNEYFNKNESRLTDNDKKTIGKLHAKYLTIRAKAYGKQLKKGIEDAATYIEGFIEGLTEEIENTDDN